MDEKKKSVVQPQEKIEELSDAQLSQVCGGFEMPILPTNAVGLKFGQALEQPSCFTKSDDCKPENRGC